MHCVRKRVGEQRERESGENKNGKICTKHEQARKGFIVFLILIFFVWLVF